MIQIPKVGNFRGYPILLTQFLLLPPPFPLKIFGEFDDAATDSGEFRRECFEFSERVKGVLL
jgi:hypothetical protein